MPSDAPTAVDSPECPEWLDDVASKEWVRMVAILGPTGALTPLSGQSLALYCDAFSRLQEARKDIAAHGVTVCTDKGSLKTNPAVGVAAAADAIMLRVLADLSRSASTVVEPAKDELSEFLTKD